MMQHVQGPPTASLGHGCSCLHPASWSLDPAQVSLPIPDPNPCYLCPGALVREVHVLLLPPELQPSDWAKQWPSFPGLAMPNKGGALATLSRYPVHSCTKVAIPWGHSFPEDWGYEPKERGGSLTLSTGALIFIWHWVPQIL